MNRSLTRRIAEVEQYDVLVGVDLGKHKNVAVKISRQGKVLGRRQFRHERLHYEGAISWMKQPVSDNVVPQVLVGMEPTNDYWRWWAGYIEQCDIAYRLVNPFTVKKYREGMQPDYAKDDRRDALAIAHLLRTGQYTETQLLHGAYAMLRSYEQGRWRLRKDLIRNKTLLRQYVEQLFPEIRQVFADLTCLSAQALLARHARPAVIAAQRWEDFVSAVREDFSGRNLRTGKLRQAYDLAPHSVGVQEGEALQLLICQQQRAIQLQQSEMAVLEARLRQAFARLPQAPYWHSLPIGDVNLALIAAELGDLANYRRAAQLVKMAGIQPVPKQSGMQQRSRTPMSHKGRPRLRYYLFYACLNLIQWDQAFGKRYHALLTREKPLPKLAAVGVLMNKLLHLLWALHRQQQAYDPIHFSP